MLVYVAPRYCYTDAMGISCSSGDNLLIIWWFFPLQNYSSPSPAFLWSVHSILLNSIHLYEMNIKYLDVGLVNSLINISVLRMNKFVSRYISNYHRRLYYICFLFVFLKLGIGRGLRSVIASCPEWNVASCYGIWMIMAGMSHGRCNTVRPSYAYMR